MKFKLSKRSLGPAVTPPARADLGRAQEHAQPDGGLTPSGEHTPWPDPVDGETLLNDLATTIRRYIVLRHWRLADAIALWIAHTYTLDAWQLSPILAITAPEKRCGKTNLLTVLEALCSRPQMTANISAAALFRTVDRDQPTLLIDEADTFVNASDELRGILNSGYSRSGSITRCVGETHEPRRFATFCPKAIAKIGQLPDTLADRAIPIEMCRRKPDEAVERIRLDRIYIELGPLRRKLMRWASDNLTALRDADPAVPAELNDRAQDNWRPLLALADAAGGAWSELARSAAVTISGSSDDLEDTSLGVQLLQDIRNVFEERHETRISSENLTTELIRLPERPWADVGYGRQLTQRRLAEMLQQFKIRPGKIRIGEVSVRGYQREWFHDAFERYTTAPEVVPEQFRMLRR
jgi:putative DNA primase/helicase